ncbi:hypothetical protein AB0I34_27900 [Kribbella sp. NPDC050281]|uniref:SecDF P1 head subdomain-containing protein n=1 Tax=Kribbella sp. NPDC050281 TaxID=3155515 RepID=UPI0033E131B5
MSQQTPYPGPQYGVPPERSRGPVVLVVVLGLVLVAVLATATVLILRGRDDKPTAAAGSKPAAAGSVQFRPVLAAEPNACNGSSPAAGELRCGTDGTRYKLGAVELDGSHVSEVKAAQSSNDPTWVVNLGLDETGTKSFSELTTELTAKQPPLNQVAIVVGDRVVSAPSVNAPIIAGQVQIYGNFTQEDAEKLAADITG